MVGERIMCGNSTLRAIQFVHHANTELNRCQLNVWMNTLIYSQTSTEQSLKFEMKKEFHPIYYTFGNYLSTPG